MESDLLIKVLISVILGFLGGWIVKSILASNKLRREQQNLLQKLDACRDARESAARKVRQLRSRCSELESSFARVQGEMTQIRDNMELREKSVNALRADLFDAKSKIQEVDSLRATLAERDKKLIELNRIRAELTQKAIKATDQESMRAELDVLSARATQLESENASLLAERARLLHDLSEAREAVTAPQPQSSAAQNSQTAPGAHHRQDEELAGLQRKLTQRDAVIEKLRNDLQTSRQHLSTFQQRLHQMERDKQRDGHHSPAQRGNGADQPKSAENSQSESPSTLETNPETRRDTPTPGDGPQDDLTRIRGIGAKLQTTLHELGIFRYEQLARMDEAQLQTLADQLSSFRNRPFRDDWIGQARALMSEGQPPENQ